MTDTSAAADRLADPGPPPPPPQLPTGSDRFFSWVRGLGIARSEGWLGGVCAGIAARLRIDPIIVRGIVVVAALFGLPMLVIYAISWALLPDIAGRIHLREAFHRRFDPALVGIGILFLVGLLPVAPVFSAFLPFGYLLPPFDIWGALGILGTLLAIGAVIGLVVIIARTARATTPRNAAAPDLRTASADPVAPNGARPQTPGLLTHAPGTAAEAPLDSGDGASADSLAPQAGAAPAPEPPGPEPTASDAEIAQWRETHDAWRVQSDAWRRQQQDAERAAREQAREERAAEGAVFAAEAAERRRVRHATRPRTSFGYVVFVVGAAIVIGAVSSLWFGAVEPDETLTAVAVGVFAAALVVGVAMIVAGALRRRSGFLACVATMLLVTAGVTAVIPITRGIAFGDAYVNSYEPSSFTQLWGGLTIMLHPGEPTEPIVIEKRGGNTYIEVDPGVVLSLDVVSPDAVQWTRWDWSSSEVVDDGSWSGSPSGERTHVRQRIDNSDPTVDETATVQSVTLDQQSGTVFVSLYQQ